MNHSSTKPAFFNYIWLLEELVKRDLKIKYRRSVLGYVWSVLNPLLMMVVFTIVFSNLFKFDIPNYPLYLLCGQLIFNFFSDATTQAMNSILMGASLIKKVYLPKYIFSCGQGAFQLCDDGFFVAGASYRHDCDRSILSSESDYAAGGPVLYLSVCHGDWTDSVCFDYLFQGYRASVWCLFDRIHVYVTDYLSYFHRA